MTQEEKDLVLKDLCARLPYGVKVNQANCEHVLQSVNMYSISFDSSCAIPKPYLRPMSSMTKEEYAELRKMTITSPNLQTAVTLFWEHHYDEAPNWRNDWTYCSLPKVLDWLNARHFDYRGLIPMGLALEAPKDMYKIG